MKDPAFRTLAFEVVSVKSRILCCVLVFSLLLCPVDAAEKKKDYIKWVDFDVSYEALRRALGTDIASRDTERPLSMVELLAVAAARKGGKNLTPAAVDQAARDLRSDKSPEEFLGELYKYYAYYKEAYGAALGGLVGSYAIQVRDENGAPYWKPDYGLKAFSPIAAGWGYSDCDDFGVGRSYGFRRKHLGHDMMGAAGTPIMAVEGGTVEAMGWNQYGGWRVGIRSYDRKRYYYYAHLQKDRPFAPGLQEGSEVQAGDLIGFMGRTGYSTRENVCNIEVNHLHFGLQLIFDESQKECNSEIWIDVYAICRLLSTHRCTLRRGENGENWVRAYPYRDLDREDPGGA